MPLHGMLIAEAQGRMSRSAATNDGARQLVNYFVGQAVGQMNQVKPAAQVVLDMVEEFIEAAERIAGLVDLTGADSDTTQWGRVRLANGRPPTIGKDLPPIR